MFEIYSQVILLAALPPLHLKSRAHGVFVHVHGAESYKVEFMTGDCQTIAVATIVLPDWKRALAGSPHEPVKP